MVKVGFICEGDTEKIIVESEDFRAILKKNNIEFVHAINAEGVTELSDSKRARFRSTIIDRGAQWVVVLRDKDDFECFTKVKSSYSIEPNECFVIAQREVEAWFIADSDTLAKCLGLSSIYNEFPEDELAPFDYIKKYRGSGIVSKPKFTSKMIRLGFSVERAAQHPNCNSAKYFINKLKEIGQYHEN